MCIQAVNMIPTSDMLYITQGNAIYVSAVDESFHCFSWYHVSNKCHSSMETHFIFWVLMMQITSFLVYMISWLAAYATLILISSLVSQAGFVMCVQELPGLEGSVLWLDQRQHLLLPETRHTVRTMNHTQLTVNRVSADYMQICNTTRMPPKII